MDTFVSMFVHLPESDVTRILFHMLESEQRKSKSTDETYVHPYDTLDVLLQEISRSGFGNDLVVAKFRRSYATALKEINRLHAHMWYKLAEAERCGNVEEARRIAAAYPTFMHDTVRFPFWNDLCATEPFF